MAFFRKLFGHQRDDAAIPPGEAQRSESPDPAEAPEYSTDLPVSDPPAPPPAESPPEPSTSEPDTPWWSSDSPPEPIADPPAPPPDGERGDPSRVVTAPLGDPAAYAAASHDAPTAPQAVLTDDEAVEMAPINEGTRQLDAQSAPSLSRRRSAQGLAAAALRDIGRVRKINQDSVFAMLTTLPRENADLPIGLFIVADGMGGHDGGEIASRLAVRTVVHQVLTQLVMPALDDDMTEALQPLMVSAVQEANSAIWDYAQRISSDMGTTCTAALLLGQALYIAHVGDTRIYLLEAGGLRALTNDHSTVGRLIQLGQLNPAESRDHPLRNQLYRTIGQQPQVQVDFVYQQVGSSTHLLLCSDGLWGMVDEAQMQQALLDSPWPQDICHELIALANLAGGEDNISAVVVTLPIAERLS